MMKFFLIIVLTMIPTAGWAQPLTVTSAAAPPDSSHWGPLPARSDTTTTHVRDQSRAGWEKVAMVPYHVLGIPFRILNYLGTGTIKTLDKWGVFGLPPAEHAGLPLPYGIYLLPEGGISGLQGISYGLNFRRPNFLGPGNMAFITASNSTKHAYKLAGGFNFHLGPDWELQLGGGRADLPLTKYYGMGYNSRAGNRSFYHRGSHWVGAELDRKLHRTVSLEVRSYYSEVEAKDSRYEVDQSLSTVHAGDLPYGYPGQSRGWTFKVGLVRDATLQDGRPQNRGFQKAGISWYQDTDDPDLSFLQYSLDVQHFFPLWYTQRTLGLRFFMSRIRKKSNVEIPLTRMATMYHPNSLRGFSDLRFYGLGYLGTSVEYRWPLWVSKGRQGPGMDAYIFSDAGQVYDHNKEIALNHMDITGGFGVRFIGSQRNFMGRFELGFSDEGTEVRLTFSQNFQHHGKGLLYGKDPTRRP
jgi:outer membrane protein assembly factor BamA